MTDLDRPGTMTEALIYGIMKLQDQIMGDPAMGWRERYRAEGTEEVA